LKTRTLAIIKPDCIEKNLIGEIITKIEKAGFKILTLKMTQLNADSASGFYDVHKGKPFFEGLVEYMTEGPCLPMVLEKENAVEDFRILIGATDPKNAAEGTIRKLYAESVTRNIIHGSDSNENAFKEISYFFSRKEIIEKINY
jgi:nucleoside-diphosphate kinase